MRYFLILVLMLTGCQFNADYSEKIVYSQKEVATVSNSNTEIIQKNYDLFEVFERNPIVDFEPNEDIYLGAYINNSHFNGDFEKFENEIEKKHAIYAYKISLDESEANIQKILLNAMVNEQIPYFVIEYNMKNGFDYLKLENISKKIGQINYENLVEIMPINSNNNINNIEYINYFREGYNYFKKNSPSSSVVFPFDVTNIPFTLNYYVGDNFCDFVSIYYLDNGSNTNVTNPLSNIDLVYYSVPTKPVILNTAVSYYDNLNSKYNIESFESKLEAIYKNTIYRYNNIKAIVYWDIENSNDGNMYNLEAFEEALEIYKDLISQDKFLSTKIYERNEFQEVMLPFEGISINDELYIDSSYFSDYSYKIDHKTKNVDGKLFLYINDFVDELKSKKVIVNEENKKIKIE